MSYKVLGFDFDGTLVDSEPAIAHATRTVMRRLGITMQGLDLVRLGALSLNDYGGHLGIRSEDQFEAFKESFRTVFDNESYRLVCKKPGLDTLLRRLSDASPRHQVFLLTNRRIESVRQILHTLGIDCFGQFTWSASEGPSEGNRKASVLSSIVRENYNAADTAYIGDAAEDIHAARYSEVTSVFINNRRGAPNWASFGFAPDYSFENLLQLSDFIGSNA